jgi:hypothetical protein
VPLPPIVVLTSSGSLPRELPEYFGVARRLWDPAYLRARNAVLIDDRPGAPVENLFRAGNLGEAGHFLFGFESLWLPRSLLQTDGQERLAEALFAATRHWPVELHFQKGPSGQPRRRYPPRRTPRRTPLFWMPSSSR